MLEQNQVPKIKDRAVVIRHGNSKFNYAYEDSNYKGDPMEDINMIDAPLSELGELECKYASKYAY